MQSDVPLHVACRLLPEALRSSQMFPCTLPASCFILHHVLPGGFSAGGAAAGGIWKVQWDCACKCCASCLGRGCALAARVVFVSRSAQRPRLFATSHRRLLRRRCCCRRRGCCCCCCCCRRCCCCCCVFLSLLLQSVASCFFACCWFVACMLHACDAAACSTLLGETMCGYGMCAAVDRIFRAVVVLGVGAFGEVVSCAEPTCSCILLLNVGLGG